MDGTLWYGLYDMALREAVHGLKFSGRRRLAEPLAALLSSLDIPGDIDGVVPVPPGRARLRERGFSHTHLLARAMGRARGLPVLPDALRKTRETPPQVGLKKKDREGNLRGAFAATRPLPGARIVLLDDVITTGATVRECALALRRAGARRVWVVAVAKTAFL
jgi:ComF family protein